MAAYILSEVEFLNEARANEYRMRAAASIAAHGGRYLARGAVPTVLEGAETGRRWVMVEFPSRDRAEAWYRSSEYAEALKFRDEALERRLILIDGVPPEPS